MIATTCARISASDYYLFDWKQAAQNHRGHGTTLEIVSVWPGDDDVVERDCELLLSSLVGDFRSGPVLHKPSFLVPNGKEQ